MRVLVIEDDYKVASFIEKGLKQESYAVDVLNDGIAAGDQAGAVDYDAVVLDLMLPGRTGFQVLRDIRARKQSLPVIVLTAKASLDERVAGLDAGADDYMTKPFALAELSARLRAAPPRHSSRDDSPRKRPRAGHRAPHVRRAGVMISLKPEEYALLEFLMRHSDRPVTKSLIIEHVSSVGINYIHRNTGRVLEDVADCPMAAYFTGTTSSICTGVSYILTNPNRATAVNPAVIAADPRFADVAFADPRHVYDAVEFTWNTRFSTNWSALASYRWSRLRGNFEGFYRDDNGQSDPGISSLYDFPQIDPTYTSIGVPQFGFEGDIRFLGDPNGVLPLDRPHQFKVYGQYTWHDLNLGLGLFAGSGAPLTPLGTNPAYGNGGEIPTGARSSGIQTVDGFKTRTPFQSHSVTSRLRAPRWLM